MQGFPGSGGKHLEHIFAVVRSCRRLPSSKGVKSDRDVAMTSNDTYNWTAGRWTAIVNPIRISKLVKLGEQV
jgi:hypothetical protein